MIHQRTTLLAVELEADARSSPQGESDGGIRSRQRQAQEHGHLDVARLDSPWAGALGSLLNEVCPDGLSTHRAANVMGRRIQTGTGSALFIAGVNRKTVATLRAAWSSPSLPEDSSISLCKTRPASEI